MVPRSEPDNYRLLSDQPWRDAADPFGFEHLAARLKRLILDSRLTTPFTVGIEASWGAGKSSLMQQLERQLIGEESPSDREHWWPRFARPRPELEIRTVWFNAWTAAEADVQEGLVKSVLQALDRRILARALRKKKLITLLRAVVLTAAGFFKLTPLVNAAWESLSADARTRNEINDLISHAVSEWADPSNGLVRRRSTGLVVVFIDDLDRCSRANVTRVLEAVKLYLNAPGLVFIIGYDPQRIEVADRSSGSDAVPADADNDYLDKVIQIVFRIPPPDEATARKIIPALKDGRTDAALFDDASAKLIVEYNGRNPRRIKRFVNRFIVDYQLHETVEGLEPALLVKALVFETHFPSFARMLAVDLDPNPIEHFVLYVDAREAVRRQAEAAAVASLLAIHGRTPEGSAGADALAQLEEEELIPPTFVDLSRNRDFVQLARSLVSADEQQRLCKLMQRRRRERFNFDGLDLRDRNFDGADLSGASLVGADLSGVSAERVILAGADLANARLDESRLRAADLRNANLSEATLVGADLREARLADADVNKASLRNAQMAGASLDRAKMYGVDLTGASLLNAKLRQADLRLAALEGADLSRAYLHEARLEGASFEGANFHRTDLTGAQWDPVGRHGPRGSRWQRTQLTDLDGSPSVLSLLRAKGILAADDLVGSDPDSLLAADQPAAESISEQLIQELNLGSPKADFRSLVAAGDPTAQSLLDLTLQAMLVTYLGQLNTRSIRGALRDHGIRTFVDFLAVFGPDGVSDPRPTLTEDSPLAPFLERFRVIAAHLASRGDPSGGDESPSPGRS
jgi:uncharacterized protein YjbI with pentapeptide repeats